MIIDNHAHIFPYLGGNSEYQTKGIQLLYAQKLIHGHFEQIRRKDDCTTVDAQHLWDKDKLGPDGRRNVNFRAGKFGRYEWTVDGIDYFKQFMPVGLQNMESPTEFILAQMNYIGVDKAVLQRNHAYGKLENFYFEANKKFPDKFVGLTQIDESRCYYDDQIEELHRAIDKLGLKGLYFEPRALFLDNFKHTFDDETFNTFWAEVNRLSIPVYVEYTRSNFIEEMKRWANILAKYPKMVLVMSCGLPPEQVVKEDRFAIHEIVEHLVTEHEVYLEVCYPIMTGRDSEYPFPKDQEIIKYLVDRFGPEKLVWGTDIPNIERYCTYAQSLNYLKEHCDFLSESDEELILGKNVAKIFGLDS